MNPTQDTYRHRILKVQLHIQEYLDEDLSLERLARIAHFSPFHFHRIFSALVGESVHDYVRRLRLEAAAMLLMTTDRPITQIAFDSGYDTHESFTRAFRQMFGVSPSQFRAGQRGEGQVPHSHSTKEDTTMTTLTTTPEVRIRTIEPLHVAFLRHIGPYQEVGPTFERFMGWAAQRGLFRPGALVLGISWDNPDVTAAEKIRYDCCITVGPDFQAEGEVGVQTLEGGDYAVATHQGSYTELGAVWGWIYGTWLPASGREPRNGPSFSVYHNTPRDTPPEQLVTDIYLPLEPR